MTSDVWSPAPSSRASIADATAAATNEGRAPDTEFDEPHLDVGQLDEVLCDSQRKPRLAATARAGHRDKAMLLQLRENVAFRPRGQRSS